ncbi:helix-turn-helix domain-containing protein [Jatrophihabitans sp.]|uniref:helix-turn-helix domain-containing protein n=1 Tax=Jatrophihabitans sp. TaxID=1932789 RepID=UPI0030C6C6F5|nr:family transcriptional regulator [Jatrophihabitans sp.]
MAARSDDRDLEVVLGSGLRSARRRAGLTMARLAELSGVSQPHLSQLENGKVSPSINTLYRLANALGISPQQLLPGSAPTSIAVIRAGSVTPTAIMDSPGSAMARVLVGSPDRMLQVQELTVEAGHDLGGFFSHEGEEYLYVLAGRIRLELAGEPAEVLELHDSAWYDSTLDHRWALIDDEPAQLLVVSAVSSRPTGHGASSEARRDQA